MWLIYMIYPEINTVAGSKKGTILTAQGLIRIKEDLHVGHARTEKEAKAQCVRLAIQQLKDHGHNSTVIGYGIKNYYAPKGSKLRWKISIQQLLRVLQERKARRDAAKALIRTGQTKAKKTKAAKAA